MNLKKIALAALALFPWLGTRPVPVYKIVSINPGKFPQHPTLPVHVLNQAGMQVLGAAPSPPPTHVVWGDSSGIIIQRIPITGVVVLSPWLWSVTTPHVMVPNLLPQRCKIYVEHEPTGAVSPSILSALL